MLTAERARQVVSYDPTTGVMTWTESKNWRRKVGGIAGTKSNQHGRTYVVVSVDSKSYRAHRLAWLLVHGRWPNGDIDHKNGDTLDNRLENLRECTRAENLWNMKRPDRNNSGVKGVHWDRRDQRWVATITVRGTVHCLGYFRDKADAASARAKAATELHGEFARIA